MTGGRTRREDATRELRRSIVVIAAAYAAAAGLGLGVLAAAGGFSQSGGAAHDARDVGTLRIGHPLTPVSPTDTRGHEGSTPNHQPIGTAKPPGQRGPAPPARTPPRERG